MGCTSSKSTEVVGDTGKSAVQPAKSGGEAPPEKNSTESLVGKRKWSSEDEVINEPQAMEQACGDREFLHELLGDMANEKNKMLSEMQGAIHDNDHNTLRANAHTIKGSALNLALTSLANCARDMEDIGKELEKNPTNEQELANRQQFLDQLTLEYERLDKYITEVT
eukprot:57456_1